MLRCSKCGTINADENSFCNSCGAKLDRSTILCPKCGTMNAVGNIFCDNCQTQLISPDIVIPPEEKDTTITPVKGISLPTRSNSDEEPIIPEWLQQLTDDVERDSSGEPSEKQDNVLSDDDQVDYELPDWLSRQTVQDDNIIEEQANQTDLQDDITPNSVDMSDSISSGSDELPGKDYLFQSQQPSESEIDDQKIFTSPEMEDAPTSEIPDWLTVITDEIDAASSTPLSAPDIPEWLASLAEDVDDSTPSETDQPLPAWLQSGSETGSVDSTSEDVAETDDSAIEAPFEQEQDLSLISAIDDEQSEVLLERKKDDITPPATPDTEQQISPRSPQINQIVDDIDLTPDWLSIPVTDIETHGADVDKEEDDQKDKPDEESESAIPDWLSALGEQTVEIEPTTTPKLSTQTVAAQEDLPSWLSEINISQDTQDDSTSVFTGEGAEVLTTETLQPDTPSWLDEVSPLPDTIALKPAAPAFIASEEEPAQKSDKEVPDHDEVTDASFPSWLNELRLPESEETTSDSSAGLQFGLPVSEFSSEIDEVRPGETGTLARAEVPEWLHDLKPPEGGTWPPVATIPSREAQEVGEITPAEVPDWVQSLRPRPGEQREKAPEPVIPLEPAEIEGPLASITGILPPSSIIDMPIDYKANIVKIPENVIQQAHLWQQLLEQPRSSVRKATRRGVSAGSSFSIMRIIVTAILFLGSIAALWLLPPSNFAVVSSMGQTPGLRKLVDSVDALLPGETVIVAVEYGWAQAEEMTIIANAILSHLMDQKVNVIAVSTMPEGTAMISRLLETNKLSNNLSRSTPYLSDSASGIASFLAEPEAQSARMLIILSSKYDRIRWWIEQNQSVINTQDHMPLTVNAGLSASVGPLTTPYLTEQNTHGWVIGFQDALSYQALRGIQNSEQTHLLDVLLVMHWTAIILLIIGFLYSLVSGKKKIA